MLGHASVLMRFIIWLYSFCILFSFGTALRVPVLFTLNKPLKHLRFGSWSSRYSTPLQSAGEVRIASKHNLQDDGGVDLLSRHSNRINITFRKMDKSGRRAKDIISVTSLFHDPNMEDISYVVTNGLKFMGKAAVRAFWIDFIAQDYRMAERLDTRALTMGMFLLLK